MQFKLGDRVIKSPLRWIPSEFDTWGAGDGIGLIVGTAATDPAMLGPGEVDVQWPAGRAWQREFELLPLPLGVMAPQRC